MGEAKCCGRPPSEADRLPDFIFGRDKAAEEANGFTLAGKLVTDILRHKKPSERETVARITFDTQKLECLGFHQRSPD
jgi:hypothetical protein